MLVLKVRITKHASERCQIRAPASLLSRPLRREVGARLNTLLRLGAPVDTQGGVHVDLPEGLTAVCAPSEMGGWDVVTFYLRKGEAG